MIRPEDIQCIGQEVAIRWQDGSEDYLPMEKLRALSPSAEQQGERDLLGKTIGGSMIRDYPGVTVTGWAPVGGYGVQFSFSDGHRTGIYTFAYLKEIASSLSA
jgi:DUF971 family protein